MHFSVTSPIILVILLYCPYNFIGHIAILGKLHYWSFIKSVKKDKWFFGELLAAFIAVDIRRWDRRRDIGDKKFQVLLWNFSP